MVNFQAFLIYLIVTTFTPGPNNILSMVNAMQYGYRKVLGFLAGIFIGFTIVMLICGLLNLILVNFIPQAEFWLEILGAAYMLYLALHIIITKPIQDEAVNRGLNTFLTGFSMQFFNVKVILYGITIYSLFIIHTYRQPLILVSFAPLLAAVGYLSTTLWAIAGSRLHNLNARYQRVINLVMGLLLIYSAVISLIKVVKL